MRRWVTTTLAGLAALSAASIFSTPAAAMPVGNLAAAANELSVTENVAWVCGPYRCWWTPSYYYYRPVVVVRPRPFYGYGPVYGWGYGPSYGYRVVGPGPWGYRRAWYGRRAWR